MFEIDPIAQELQRRELASQSPYKLAMRAIEAARTNGRNALELDDFDLGDGDGAIHVIASSIHNAQPDRGAPSIDGNELVYTYSWPHDDPFSSPTATARLVGVWPRLQEVAGYTVQVQDLITPEQSVRLPLVEALGLYPLGDNLYTHYKSDELLYKLTDQNNIQLEPRPEAYIAASTVERTLRITGDLTLQKPTYLKFEDNRLLISQPQDSDPSYSLPPEQTNFKAELPVSTEKVQIINGHIVAVSRYHNPEDLDPDRFSQIIRQLRRESNDVLWATRGLAIVYPPRLQGSEIHQYIAANSSWEDGSDELAGILCARAPQLNQMIPKFSPEQLRIVARQTIQEKLADPNANIKAIAIGPASVVDFLND